MARCEYRHKVFVNQNAFNPNGPDNKHDGTDQCWMEDATKFGGHGNFEGPFCIFHAVENKPQYPEQLWRVDEIGKLQAKELHKLLKLWNDLNSARKENDETLFDFVLPGAKCGGIHFGSGYEFSSNIYFIDVHFKGDVNFFGTVFADGCILSDTMFDGTVNFSKAKFKRILLMPRMHFKGDAVFNSAIFETQAIFTSSEFQGKAIFEKSKFHKECWFRGVKFLDDNGANFRGVTFINIAHFDKVQSSGRVDFSNSRFDNVDFESARFGGQAWFSKAEFGKVCFDYVSFEKGASFNFSIFSGKCEFGYANLNHRAVFSGCDINQFRYLTHVGEGILFNKCNVSRKMDYKDQDCSGLAFLDMDLSKANFLGANVRETRFDSCEWVKPVSPPSYLKVCGHDEVVAGNDNGEIKKLKSLYRQLATNLERNRDYQQSGDFHYQEMVLREKLIYQSIQKNLIGPKDEGGIVDLVLLRLYGFVGDYGENWVRLFGWLVGSFFFASLIVTWVQRGYGFLFISTMLASCLAPMGMVFFWSRIGTIFRYVDRWLNATMLAWFIILLAFEWQECAAWHYFELVIVGAVPTGFQRSISNELNQLFLISKAAIFIETFVAILFATLFVMAIRRRFRR